MRHPEVHQGFDGQVAEHRVRLQRYQARGRRHRRLQRKDVERRRLEGHPYKIRIFFRWRQGRSASRGNEALFCQEPRHP